jgi:hypothetical protein
LADDIRQLARPQPFRQGNAGGVELGGSLEEVHADSVDDGDSVVNDVAAMRVSAGVVG